MRSSGISLGRALGGAVVMFGMSHAQAQLLSEGSPLDPNPQSSLLEFPEEVAGIRTGHFQMYPQASIAAGYDSNVLATPDAEASDVMAAGQLAAGFDNELEGRRLTGGAFYRGRRFNDTRAADTDEFGAAGRFKAIENETDTTTALLTAQRRFESRTEVETPDFIPVSYYRDYLARLEHEHLFNRFSLRATANGRRLDYTDATQEFRDRWQYGGELRGAYILRNGLSLLTTVYANREEFSNPSTLVSSADTSGALLGTQFSIPEVLDFEFSAGYFRRSYADNRGDLTGFTVRGVLDWQPTRLMNVRGELLRQDEATQVLNALGKVRTSLSLQVDHAYRRGTNLYLRGRVLRDDFDQVERSDTAYVAETGVNVLLNRRMVITVSYAYASRSSDIVDDNFQRHLAAIALIRRF